MPLPAPPTHKLDNAANRRSSTKADNELLLKGALCAAIGTVVLVGPYVARSPSVQELMGGASAAGWFALALGLALVGLYARNRFRAMQKR